MFFSFNWKFKNIVFKQECHSQLLSCPHYDSLILAQIIWFQVITWIYTHNHESCEIWQLVYLWYIMIMCISCSITHWSWRIKIWHQHILKYHASMSIRMQTHPRRRSWGYGRTHGATTLPLAPLAPNLRTLVPDALNLLYLGVWRC
jgi:hypothetical protein